MPKSKPKKIKPSGRKSQVSLGIAALVFLVLLMVVGKLLGLIGALGQPFSPDSSAGSIKQHQWTEDRTLNLVIKSDRLSILSFNPREKTVTLVKIPDETYLSIPFGFGRWPSSSIYDLGQAEKPPVGAVLIKETISLIFGIPIDGYLILSSNSDSTRAETVLEKLRTAGFSGLGILKQSKTDLTPLELMRLWWKIKGVRSDKVKILDLGDSQITEWILLADGRRGLTLDQLKLDQYIQGQFEDNKIRDEGLSVGIFNATEHPGLAEKAARVVSNMGGRVIFTSNYKDNLSSNRVFGKKSYTINRLSEIFGPACALPCNNGTLEPDFSRADVTVILGEDYFLRYSERVW